MYIKKIFSALRTAWDELFDFPLPEFIRRRALNEHRNNLVPGAFPALGFIVGAMIFLAALLVEMIVNQATAAILFAIAGWLVLSVRDSARGDSKLGKYLSSKMQNGGSGEVNHLFFLPGIIKFAMLLLLGMAGYYFYFAILLTAAFGFQAALVLDDECPINFLIRNERSIKIFRVTLIFLGLFCFTGSRMGTLAALVVTLFAGKMAIKRLKKNGFTADNISFAGNITEIFLLLAGILTI